MKKDFLEMCKLIETGQPAQDEHIATMLQSLGDYVTIVAREFIDSASDEVVNQIKEVANRIESIKHLTTTRTFSVYFAGAGPAANALRNYLIMSATFNPGQIDQKVSQEHINKFCYSIENDQISYNKLANFIKNLVVLDLNSFIPEECYVSKPFEHNRIGGYSHSMAIRSIFNNEEIKELLLYKKLDNGVIISFSFYINKPEWNENKVWYYHPYENRWLMAYPGSGLVGAIEELTNEYQTLLNSYTNLAFDFDTAKLKLDSLAEYVFMKSTGVDKQITLASGPNGSHDINSVSFTTIDQETIIRIPIRNSEISNPNATGYTVNYIRTTGEYPSTNCVITQKQTVNDISMSIPDNSLTPLAKKVIAVETEQALNYLITLLSNKEYANLSKSEITMH